MNHSSLIKWLKKNRAAVLKGGWSRERSISLKTGQAVEESLRRMKIPFVSVDVHRDFMEVLKKRKIGFCFIALHGTFGEDGGIQSCLDFLKIPYSGSSASASTVAMDKNDSKKIFQKNKIPTAPWVTLARGDSVGGALKLMAQAPVFIKPVN